MVKLLANIITCIRIVGSIVLLPISVFSTEFYIIYLLCGLSDMIDGAVARKTNTVSEFGSKLDSVADIIFVIIAMIKLLPEIPIQPWTWNWIGAIAIIKIINITRGYIYTKQFTFPHTIPNKAAGLALFLMPVTLNYIELKYSCIIVCSIATFAAIHEGFCIHKATSI